MPIRFRLSKTQSELLHYFLSGLGVAVAASLTGAVSSGVWSLATLTHAVLGAAIVALAATIAKASGPDTPPAPSA